MTIGLTFGFLLIGAFQLKVYRQQKEIMASSGQQTDQLITAANVQASASQRNADAASDFTRAAQEQSRTLKTLVGQATSDVRLQTQLAAVSLGFPQLALTDQWLGVYPGDKRNLSYQIAVRSIGGKTGAEEIRVACNAQIRTSPPTDYKVGPAHLLNPSTLPAFRDGFRAWTAPLQDKGTANLEPHAQDIPRRLRPPVIPERDSSKTIYIWGRIEYRDSVTRYKAKPVRFCRYITVAEVLNGPSGGIVALQNCPTSDQ
jgi:hypothetical protein